MTDKKITRIKFLSIFLILIFAVCMSASFCNIRKVSAGETEKTEEEIMEGIKAHRDSIVRVESICWNGDEEIYRTKSFSGFVVSKDTTGIYIVTVHNNLTYTSEDKENIKKEYELENNVRISEKIEVIFSGDLRIQASIVGESEQRNLTVLKLDQAINFENILQFAEKNTSDKERIFLLSYPEAIDQDCAVYNIENVMITSGISMNSYMSDEITFLKHDIQTDVSSVGGPLLNEDGLVIGLLLTSRAEEDGTAISCDSLKAFLDTFNVSYQEYEEVVEEEKLPILNILLGVVIVVLVLIIAVRRFRRRSGQEKKEDKYSSRTLKEETRKSSGKKSGKIINASLEYPSEKRIVIIHKAVFVIGRAKEADFILSESKGISRKHACIQFDGRSFYLTDLKSTNHTFLNGLELTPGEKRVLRDGDEIMVGKEKLIFSVK